MLIIDWYLSTLILIDMLKNNINDEYLVNLYLITKYYTSN